MRRLPNPLHKNVPFDRSLFPSDNIYNEQSFLYASNAYKVRNALQTQVKNELRRFPLARTGPAGPVVLNVKRAFFMRFFQQIRQCTIFIH